MTASASPSSAACWSRSRRGCAPRVVGWQLWVYYMDAPWTRDGRVRADVVAVAPDVSGLVTDVLVQDNQAVRQGRRAVPHRSRRFALALRAGRGDVGGPQGRARSRDRRRSAATSSSATPSSRRRSASRSQAAPAAGPGRGYQQAIADRDLAKLNLDRSEVRASVNGTITNMDLRPGDYVAAGKGVMALVDTDSLHVDGYFEETKLPRIHVGDPVAVRLHGREPGPAGHVESIAGGIEDRERGASSNLLANINPSFTWVRLAQRIPVRVALDHVPDGVQLLAGRTATVVVEPKSGGGGRLAATPGGAAPRSARARRWARRVTVVRSGALLPRRSIAFHQSGG